MMFIHIISGDNRVVSIEVMRVTDDWHVPLVYAARICEQVTVASAIKPIAAMLGRSDIIIFQMQHERDVFVQLAKRVVDRHMSVRARIIPVSILGGHRYANLKALLGALRDTGLSVTEFRSQLIS